LIELEQSVRQQPLEVESEVMVEGGLANASLSLAQLARFSRDSWHFLDRESVNSVSAVRESTEGRTHGRG
jgi:hypothetical protein